MSDEKNELENLEEDSFADFDALSDFAEIDDLSALEGMQEFIDSSAMEGLGGFADLSDMGDLEMTLPEAEDIPLPDTTDEMAGEIPLPELGEMTDEIPLPEEAEMTGEISMPEPEEGLPEIPIPEPEEMTDAISLPETEDGASDIPLPEAEEMTGGIPLPEQEETMDIPMPEMDEMADGIPIPELTDISDGNQGLEAENAGEETLAKESESNLDDMLDGLLDNLDMTGSMPAEQEAGITLEEDAGDDMADLFGLLDDNPASADMEDVMEIGLPEQPEGPEPSDEEPGLLKKLFGNIVTDEIAEAERQAMEEEKAVAAEKAETDAKRKEEKAVEKAAKAEQRAAAKAERKAAKEAAKAAKAEEKAKKAAEAAEAEEQFEVTGKLNKAGVAIIAVLTVVFLVTEIAGTNIHSINHTRKEANSYFELGKYTQAYQEILGTNLQKKDPDTYNKIKTVMQVQRSINAYQNYNEMNYYPEALNALLRGVQRYDANLETAKELDVVSDMDTCREQILQLLQSEFGISESDAYALLALEQEQYTTKVVQLAMSKH